MTMLETVVLIFLTPFLLFAGSIFATLAMDFIFNLFYFIYFIGTVLWELATRPDAAPEPSKEKT